MPHSWETNAAQSAAQLFWRVNRFHDHLAAAPIGFDAASGAFQGSDPIIAQAMDGANGPGGTPDADHISNANMLTLPDGAHGYMQMYLFGAGFPEVDGANDASIVYHEYTHGLSGRLVTYADGWDAMWAGIDGGQSGALGEGTSDWYAMDYLVGQGLEPDGAGAGDVRVGEYADGGSNLIRFEGLDCPVGAAACAGTPGAGDGGFDYSDYGSILGFPETHADGEIWAQTLWDIRSALIAARAADGLARARRYVTGGLRLAPPEPSFLELRDAILQAAAASGGGGDLSLLWQAFAARGMGFSAATAGPLDSTPTAGFDRAPGAVTGAASAVGQTSATLHGVVDPAGIATLYRFDYGETLGYGAGTFAFSAGAGGPLAVAQGIAGLRPGTTYHYRVVAIRNSRSLPGLDRTFTTAPATVPLVPPVGVGPLTRTLATILATRLRADRNGRFKVRVTFAATAPRGSAKVTVRSRGRRLAARRFDVEPSETVAVRLRLSASGRRIVRRGHSKRVTVELRLPDGTRVNKTVRLARRR
jgi:hypothetical protein